MPDDHDKACNSELPDAKLGFVAGYLSNFLSYVYKIANTKSQYITDGDIQTTEFETVTDFWKAARRWYSKTPPAQYISIKGALSRFAPILPGDPNNNRDIHRYIRRNYDEIQKSFERTGRKEKPTTLDAFMAFSSGQMVIRLSPEELPYVYMGLYHSIVRNSIPVFVERSYYFKVIEHALLNNKPSSDTIEASVTGRLLPMPDTFVVQFLKDLNLYDSFKQAQVDRLLPRFALQVDGNSDPTHIQPISRARYLDGDIWVAILDGKNERVVSRFLDLANPEDISSERGALKTEVAHYYGDCEVISEYDDTDWIFPDHHIIDPTVLWCKEKENTNISSQSSPDKITTINMYAKEVKMSQDTINVHNVGGIVNVKSTLSGAIVKIESATAVGDSQRSELKELFKQLETEVALAEKTKPEDSARVAQTADLVATEVAKTKPDRSFLKITTEGLIEAAKALESVTPTIVNIVSSIVKLVLI